ncbi:MAG: YlmH/Sll1252 family protein [Bacillota bacterium]|nr:YlmH/Sll1252 family protein [Bacillota bacterium]
MDRQALLKSVPEGEERLLFAKALDQAYLALKRREPAFTDFMDRAKCARFRERMQGIRELRVTLFGGTEDCERQQMGFFSEEISSEEFPIRIIQIKRKSRKFGQSDLSHRDYLGSILGLGIDRGKVGDILVTEEGAVCFAAEEIAPYITAVLEQVSRTAVVAEEVPFSAGVIPKRQTEIVRLTVASLRLDAVAAEAFHLARGKVQPLIQRELAQVNWNTVTNTSHPLQEGDLVSVRGFGRFRIIEIGGKTRKDRTALEIEKYI